MESQNARGAENRTRNPARVLVIGLDGATFRVLTPLVEMGMLPNLRRLVVEGAKGILTSTLPPTTPPGWTSIFTGKSPGSHGVFDFSSRIPNSYDRTVVNSTCRRGKPIWTLLSRVGKCVAVVNVPLTYPPEEVNGCMISGMFTPSIESSFTYPKEFKEELLERFPDYVIDPDEKVDGHASSEKQRFLHVERATKQLRDLTIFMMRNMEWDFFALVFVGPDRMQHVTGVEIDSVSSSGVEENLLVAHLKTIDSCIGAILAEVDDDTVIVICSDHGFRSVRKRVHAMNWLEQMGYLRFESKGDGLERSSLSLTAFSEFVRSTLKRMHLGDMVRILDESEAVRRISWSFRKRLLPDQNTVFAVDWDTTKAYFVSETSQGISVNLEGREPRGIVRPGREFEDLLDRVTQDLCGLVDPENGQEIVEKVLKGKEVHKGRFAEEAPDLYIVTKEGYRLTDGFSLFGVVRYLEHMKGDHDSDGILIMKGRGIAEGHRLDNARVEDLVPTILYAMGIPIPADLNGRILVKAFEDEFLSERYALFEGDLPGRFIRTKLSVLDGESSD